MKPAFNNSRKYYFAYQKAQMCDNDSCTAKKKQKGKVKDTTGRPWTRNEHSYSSQIVDSFQRTEYKGG
jgi:hypothetical protein